MKAEDITGFMHDDGTPQGPEDLCCFHDSCSRPWGGPYLFVARDEGDWVPICYRCFLLYVGGVPDADVEDIVANAEGWHKY